MTDTAPHGTTAQDPAAQHGTTAQNATSPAHLTEAWAAAAEELAARRTLWPAEIGRASCRERV